MTSQKIRFGTDGWRGIIAEDFTFSNVRRVAQAVSDYLKNANLAKEIAIGFDGRFLSEEFSLCMAEVFSANNIHVYLGETPCPTPHLSFFVKRKNLPLGIMVTASHNHYSYNGIKIKETYGGSAKSETTMKIEALLDSSPISVIEYKKAIVENLIEITALNDGYDSLIRSLIDLKAIRSSHISIVADSMGGVGFRHLERYASSKTCKVNTIRAERDPRFSGLAPEPKPEFLKPLRKALMDSNAEIGLATDGDADRSGGIHIDGSPFTPLEMMALLALYLIEEKKMKGILATTNAQSLYIKRIADEFGLPYINCPVGFKYIAEIMQKDDLLLGGEESGGIAFKGFIPERDGILINLLIMEMLAVKRKKSTELLKILHKRYGEYYFRRKDFSSEPESGMERIQKLQKNPPSAIGGMRVLSIDTLDGLKFFFEDGSWLLLRQSGTEPILRVYCEANGIEKINRNIDEAKSFVTK